MQRVLVASLLVLVVAGCGGSSSTAEPAATALTVTPRTRALDRYPAAVRLQYGRFGVLSQQVMRTLRGVNVDRPDASWDRAALRLALVATAFRSLALSLATMHVPRPLREAHFRLAEGVGIFAEYVDGVRAALQVRIPSALGTAAAGDITRALGARAAWGDAVTLYAARIGTVAPGWVSPGPAA